MPTYYEKNHHHVGKNVADVGFAWHPDTLFQPNDISVGTSLSLVEKHNHFQDRRQEINAPWQLCIIYLDFFFLADLNSLDTAFDKHTCYLFLLIKYMVKNVFKFNTTTVKQSSFIHLIRALL